MDNKTVDAVIRNFEIIGEAARNIPAEIKQQHPQIEWKKIYLFRNVLAHEYFGVNKKMVWDMIQNHLGDLKRDVTGLLDTTS